MPEVVICEPLRTAVGRFGGALRDVPAADLGTAAVAGLIKRTSMDVSEIDDVIFGHCYPNSEAPAIGRVIALDAGLPVEVPGMQIDRRCGSGLQAVINSVMQVATGGSTLVLAGGAESMSGVPFYTNEMRWGARSGSVTLHDPLLRGRSTPGGRRFPVDGGMLETAENLRREYNISRAEQDAFALRSHQRAVAAQRAGLFRDEIVPVTVHGRHGDKIIDTDEHPRAETSLASLGTLAPARLSVDPDSTVTAGNASGQNDGAAACIVTTRDNAERLGVRSLARLASWSVSGVHPAMMGIGPVPATAAALARAKLNLKDIDLIEINEAFAAQVLACTREWRLGTNDFDRVNVNGSGISLGHPVGATGGRILATMLREMDRRNARYGLETMCIGGGQGIAAVFERIA
jgi:acetyl-CoA C-acetyltransferase